MHIAMSNTLEILTELKFFRMTSSRSKKAFTLAEVALRQLRLPTKASGFTLAEVLVVITVLGVTAAMAIPSLLSSLNDMQYKTAWKNTYSNIEQAAAYIKIDSGGNFLNLCSTTNCLRDKFLSRLNYVKKCDANDANGNCWHAQDSSNYMNGNIINMGNNPSAILNDGTLLNFILISSSCNGTDGPLSDICARINVDINGLKEPNVLGKDIFSLFIFKDNLKPRGFQYDGPTGQCGPGTSGWGCSAEYLYK